MQKTVKKTQKGFTLIELLIVIAVIAILAAIAIPNLLSSRKAANESSAIASCRTLVSAEETYRSRQNPPKYGTLADLNGANLIDPVLGTAVDATTAKSGYFFTTGTVDSNMYSFKASHANNAGERTFYVDQTGVIRVATDPAVADGTSSPLQ